MKLILLAVIMIKAGTQLIDNALSVCPEWQLVKNFVVLFLFYFLDCRFPFLSFQTGKIDSIEVIGRSQQKFVVICPIKTFCLFGQNKKFLCFSAVDVDAVIDGHILSRLRFVLLFAVTGEEQAFIIQPQKIGFLVTAGQLAAASAFGLQNPDV